MLSVGPAFGMSLNEVLVEAYASNPELMAARAHLRSVDESLPQALSHWRPTIQLDASQSFSQDDVTGGTAQQNQIYSGRSPTRARALRFRSLYSGAGKQPRRPGRRLPK